MIHRKLPSFTERLKANEDDALRQLYSENYFKVEKYVLANQGTEDQARDIFQDAFVLVWQHVKTGRYKDNSPDSVNGYLYQIAKNKWLDYLRSSTYKKTTTLTQDVMEENEVDILQENAREDDQKLKRAMEAFEKLGDDCRSLLLNFYFQKKSLREIALEIEIDEASARNKKYRCMQRLRELATK